MPTLMAILLKSCQQLLDSVRFYVRLCRCRFFVYVLFVLRTVSLCPHCCVRVNVFLACSENKTKEFLYSHITANTHAGPLDAAIHSSEWIRHITTHQCQLKSKHKRNRFFFYFVHIQTVFRFNIVGAVDFVAITTVSCVSTDTYCVACIYLPSQDRKDTA